MTPLLDDASAISWIILRLSIFEIIHYNTPVDVSIDEADLLAKEYATKDDALYINGVLGSVAKDNEKILTENK